MFSMLIRIPPWERGSNEINNRFLRKEITKGEAINNYSSARIIATNDWMNHYPRAMFNGHSSMDIHIFPCSPRREHTRIV